MSLHCTRNDHSILYYLFLRRAIDIFLTWAKNILEKYGIIFPVLGFYYDRFMNRSNYMPMLLQTSTFMDTHFNYNSDQ